MKNLKFTLVNFIYSSLQKIISEDMVDDKTKLLTYSWEADLEILELKTRAMNTEIGVCKLIKSKKIN